MSYRSPWNVLKCRQMMQPLIRNAWDHLGPSDSEDKVYSVRFMMLLFQVIPAEKWDVFRQKQLLQRGSV